MIYIVGHTHALPMYVLYVGMCTVYNACVCAIHTCSFPHTHTMNEEVKCLVNSATVHTLLVHTILSMGDSVHLPVP